MAANQFRLGVVLQQRNVMNPTGPVSHELLQVPSSSTSGSDSSDGRCDLEHKKGLDGLEHGRSCQQSHGLSRSPPSARRWAAGPGDSVCPNGQTDKPRDVVCGMQALWQRPAGRPK